MRGERSLTEFADSILGEVTRRLRSRTVPSSTYRIQLSPDFPLARAAELVPYLRDLGITHLYASPFLRANPGSPHGYDVVSYEEVSPELGGEAALEGLVAALRAHGIGLIVDFVPNHMGIGSGNAFWQDVLENGPSSSFARFFDIVWKPVKDELENKVLLPVLGDQYGAVLEAGTLRLEYGEGAFCVCYFEHRFPINPRCYPAILEEDLDELEKAREAPTVDLEELLSICTACKNLPARTETDPDRLQERRREKEVIKRRLDQLFTHSPSIAGHVRRRVERMNGIPGDPRSFDALDDLLDAQAYRLAHWRVAGEEINYRRFFDINDLAAIRMEDPVVFHSCHSMILRLLAEGWVDGLRIDHPDGLYDPEAYFHRLQVEHFLDLCREAASERAPHVPFEHLEPLLRAAWASDERLHRPIYIIAEKILMGTETVPDRWAIDGTTGYDFLHRLSGILVDPEGRRPIDETFARFTGLRLDLEALLYEKKKLILNSSMAGEVNILAYRLNRISEQNRRSRDFTLNSLRSALIETIACFPVYRTYVTPSRVDPQDRRHIEVALSRAKRRSPVTNVTIFDFLRDILLLKHGGHLEEEERRMQIELAMKLQQLTGPVMAKGLEDTTFYIYNRLVALNEVGGDPSRFGASVSEFHAANMSRQRGSLLATTTHDTKRSEDARARLFALSETPDGWRRFLSRITKIARRHRVRVGEDRYAPDRNEEILLYQALLASWPFGDMGPEAMRGYTARMEAYLLKAAKEAKVNTSWINPDDSWDEALSLFVRRLLGDGGFREEFLPFWQEIAAAGILSSLSQVVLKMTSPGVPDVYQGCERYCFTLVDPDNRGPVDFEALRRTVQGFREVSREGREALARELWASREDGRIKQYVTWACLNLRRERRELFHAGDYRPLEASGPHAEHVVALARRRGSDHLLAVAPRLAHRLLRDEERWKDSHLILPGGTGGAPWLEIFTGRIIPPIQRRHSPVLALSTLLEVLPVAILVPADHPIGATPRREKGTYPPA